MKRLKISDVFIAPVIEVLNVDSNAEKFKYTCKNTNKYKVVYRQIDFDNNICYIDLETEVNCEDESKINISSSGKKYIRTSELIPMTRFMTRKYKNKIFNAYDILELADDIISDINTIKKEEEIEYLDYDKFYIAPIYQNGNMIFDKKVVYNYEDIFIDIDDKEVYILEDEDNIMDCKYIKNNDLIKLKDYILNSQLTNPKQLIKK